MKKSIRLLNFLMAIVLVLGVMAGPFMLPAAAAGTAGFAIEFQRYDASANRYVKADSAKPGDNIKLVVKNQTAIAGFGGIQFRLTYDSTYFACQTYSGKFGVSGSGLASDYTVKENGAESAVNASLDTVSDSYTLPAGELFEITMVVKTAAEGAGQVSTKADMSVQTLFDHTGADIQVGAVASAVISVGTISFSPEVLALFEAIRPENIKFNQETLNAIVAAETAVKNFTRDEFNAFKQLYPTHYANYLQARNRYNELAAEAPYEQIQAEIDAFKTKFADVLALTEYTVKTENEARIKEAETYLANMSDQAKSFLDMQTKNKIPTLLAAVYKLKYADVLALTEKTVTLAHEDRVREASRALNDMSDQAKSYLDSQTKELVAVLLAKVKELRKAADEKADLEAEVNDFIRMYESTLHNLWTVEKDTVDAAYDEIAPIVSEALMVYDGLSDAAKERLTQQKKRLDDLKKQIDELLKNDEHAKIVQDQVTEFLARWRDLLNLKASTVTVGDETALRMMLADALDADNKRTYPDEVRAKLQRYIDNAKNLLATIENMKKEQPDEDPVVPVEPDTSEPTTPTEPAPPPPTTPSSVDPDVLTVTNKETLVRQIPPIILILGCVCLGLIVVGIYPTVVYLKLMKSGALSKK